MKHFIQALVDSREQELLEPFREFMMEEHTRYAGLHT